MSVTDQEAQEAEDQEAEALERHNCVVANLQVVDGIENFTNM